MSSPSSSQPSNPQRTGTSVPVGWSLFAAFTLLVFTGAGILVRNVAARMRRPSRPDLRLAVGNIHRPGAPTTSIMLSLGLPPAVRDTAAGDNYPVGHASQVIAYPPGTGYRVVYPFGW